MKKIAVLIPSSDKYKDVISPLFFTMSKYWPDCEFKIYLITNFSKPEIKNIEIINAGEDVSWSDNLKNTLSQISEEMVLIWIDDLFLFKKVDNDRIKNILNEAISLDVNYLCLNGSPKVNKKTNKYFGEILPGSLYRVSAVFSLWKKEILFDILKSGESAWQFELEGSIRSDKYDKFFVTNKKEIYSFNSVIKGKWRNGVVKKLKNEGYVLNTSGREIFSFFQEFIFNLKQIRSFIFGFFPSKSRRFIRRLFIK